MCFPIVLHDLIWELKWESYKMVMCRACLATATDLIAMDEPFLENFNLLTGLGLTMFDKSLYTCRTCWDAVKSFIDFREKCIESDLNFQEISVTVQEIKQENESASVNKDYIVPIIKQETVAFEFYETSESGSHSENVYPIKDEHSPNPETKTITKKRKISERTKKVKREKIGTSRRTENEIKREAKKQGSVSKVHCGLCEEKFEDIAELSNHLEYHKSLFDTQVSCGLCTERFLNLPHMLGHRMDHVPTDQKICHICSRKFLSSSATCLEFHYMRDHAMADKDAPIQCKQCASSYPTSRKLIRHVRSCHAPPRFECTLCSKSFRSSTLLKIHTKMKHTEVEKSVKCDLCSFSTKYPTSLMLHIRRKHTDNTFSCKACCRIFLDEKSLMHHVTDVCKHHMRVVCAVCGHSVKKIWLKHHMRSHSDEYPFKCDQCPAKYKYRTGLKDHAVKHEGTLNHQCDLCMKSFRLKSALQSHLKTHLAGKPHICKICNTGFKRRYNLKVHMSGHPWSASSRKPDDNII